MVWPSFTVVAHCSPACKTLAYSPRGPPRCAVHRCTPLASNFIRKRSMLPALLWPSRELSVYPATQALLEESTWKSGWDGKARAQCIPTCGWNDYILQGNMRSSGSKRTANVEKVNIGWLSFRWIQSGSSSGKITEICSKLIITSIANQLSNSFVWTCGHFFPFKLPPCGQCLGNSVHSSTPGSPFHGE